MDHNAIRHKLSDYIDGQIAGAEKEEMETHLRTCEKCSEALRELNKTVEHLKRIEEVDPPAWMRQKIMAKVRDEAERSRSIFDRIADALLIKLPVKAVAVVFLAVLAFYMYRDIQPSNEPAIPMREFAAKEEAPQAGLAKDERRTKAAQSPAVRVPQKPGYRALDMKQEYEKPAPPARADKSTPAAAKPAVPQMLAKKEAAAEKQFYGMESAARGTVSSDQSVAAGAAARMEPKQNTAAAAPATQQAGSAVKAKSGQKAADSTPSTDKGPSFGDYRVAEIYEGKHARVDLSSHPDAKTWRTQLIAAANRGSNFAGHYTIATWGCGSSCIALGIIDAMTGKVYFPAALSHVSLAGLPENEEGLKFRLDSNLLIVRGSPNEEEQKGIYYYTWEHNDLTLIKNKVLP